MGRRGPKPKPAHLKLLAGNPGQRPVGNEPRPRPIAPACPAYLDRVAKAAWAALAPELESLGLLTVVDGDAFALYCQAKAEWITATRNLKKFGRVMTVGETGYEQQRPEVAIQQKSAQLMKTFAAEFGLTPSSRARLSVPPAPEEPECARCGLSQALCGCG